MSIGKLAVVGVGHWGKNLLRVFCELLGDDRVIACDSDPKRLAELHLHHPKVRTTSNFGEVLQDPEVEAVAIATPVITHFDLARQALVAGKHAFIEKPISLRSSDAQELIRLAEQNRTLLMVDHLLEYHPAVERLRQLITHKELGEIFYLYSQRLSFGIIRSEENALWSLGVHDIAVMLYLLGEDPQTVRTQGSCYLQENIEDIVLVTLAFPKDVQAHIHLSWLDPQKVRKMIVIGSLKMAIFDEMAPDKLILLNKHVHQENGRLTLCDEGARSVSIENHEPLQAACQHFLACIQKGETPRSDGYDGLRVLRVLEAAQRSLSQSGKAVSLAEVG